MSLDEGQRLQRGVQWFQVFGQKQLDAGQWSLDETGRQIDALVYELYGLTPEEIKLVEGNR
jgi:hypothetical protein